MFPLYRLHTDILSTILESAANLLLLRPSQGLLDLPSHLNYFVCYFSQSSIFAHILVFFHSQFCFLSLCSYNSLPNVQILCNYSNSYFLSYLHPWHLDCTVQILLSAVGAPLPCLFFLLLLLEHMHMLLAPAIEAFLASLATLEVVAIVVPHYSILGLVFPVSVIPLSFLLPFYFLSNAYLS